MESQFFDYLQKIPIIKSLLSNTSLLVGIGAGLTVLLWPSLFALFFTSGITLIVLHPNKPELPVMIPMIGIGLVQQGKDSIPRMSG